jgi:ABC-type lipoprotein release transport system permease subunit
MLTERQRSLARFAVGALIRRKRRALAIGLALSIVVGFVASVTWLADALGAEMTRGIAGMPDITVQGIVAGRPALVPATALDTMRARPGVRAVEARVWGYLYVPAVSANIVVVGRTPHDPPATLVAGRFPRAPGECVLGRELARALGVRTYDRIAVPAGEEYTLLRVVGTFVEASAIRTADVMLVSPADARKLLSVPEGEATDVAVFLATPDESNAVAKEIRLAMPTARVLERALLARTYSLTLDARAGLVSAMLVPALMCFLLLAWERLSGIGESERREIAILKVVGFSTEDVLTVRLIENIVVAFVAATIGAVAAYVYVFHLGAPGLARAIFGWSQITPTLRLVPTVSFASLAMLVTGTVAPFVLASIVPAWRAAMTDPEALLRGEA